ncbi:hypothetical protein D3C72_1886640 [compost metagenome]
MPEQRFGGKGFADRGALAEYWHVDAEGDIAGARESRTQWVEQVVAPLEQFAGADVVAAAM